MPRLASIVAALFVLVAPSAAFASCDAGAMAAKFPSLKGKSVRIAQDGESPPYSFRDPQDFEVLEGLDVDLAKATFTCLGLKTQSKIGKWSGLLPSVIAGQSDVMWNNLYYTPPRAEQVDFVTYLLASTGGLVKAGNLKHIGALADTCGMRAAGGLGTVEEKLLRKTSDDCVAAGKPALDITTYPDKPSGMRLVQTGRVDLMLTDGGFAGNIAKTQAADFTLAFTIRTDFKVGPGIAKSEPELREGIATALHQLEDDGTVASLMVKYGVQPSLMMPVESFTK